MMCKPCKKAGDFYQAGRQIPAKAWHERCTNPETCTCLHRVEK